MSWTPDREESAKTLWLAGKSANQIARELGGGLTRNAVIGKIARLGLQRRTPASPVRAPPPPRAARATPGAGHPWINPGERVAPKPIVLEPEATGTATVMTIGLCQCRSPIGDPVSEGFTFCGRRAPEDRPYCELHARIAYVPLKLAGRAFERSLRMWTGR